MNKTWVIKDGRKQCILYFNGWGMDVKAVEHLESNKYDVCHFNNYASMEFPPNDFNNYDSIFVIAWSLGVWVAANVVSSLELKIKKSIAINGTNAPISPTCGIPPDIFDTTLKNWNKRNRDKFNMRTLGGRSLFQEHKNKMGYRTPEDQKNELTFLKKKTEEFALPVFSFDFAFVGRKDLIFLHENQLNYWTGKASILETDWPHYPFLSVHSWDELIEQQ